MNRASRSVFLLVASVTLSVGVFAQTSPNALSVKTAAKALGRAREAAGGLRWGSIGSISATGTEQSSGGAGRWKGIENVKHGWMRRSSDFGLLRYSETWGPGGRWRVDPGEGVHPINSQYANRATITDEWMARRDYLKPGAAQAVLSTISLNREGKKAFYIVTATPLNGQAVELWFDSATFLLDRSIRVLPLYVETVSYSDYQAVDGLMLPFAIATGSGDPGDLDTVKISNYRINASLPANTFAEPRTIKDWTLATPSATVPIEVDGNITVEAMLNGKGPFAFLWDTGGHDLLTTDVANALGLNGSGSNSFGGTGAGAMAVRFTKVAKVQIGGLTLSNQTFSIATLDRAVVDRVNRPPLAGILGPELCERLSLTLNYRARTMTFQPFGSGASSEKGAIVPITFTDDMPLVHAVLDGKLGVFALDTGNSASLVILQTWAQENGLAKRLRSGKEGTSLGTGGISKDWSSAVTSFVLGEAELKNVPARYSEDKVGSFSSKTEAGNFGSSILSHFTVTFDFQRGNIQLFPARGYPQ